MAFLARVATACLLLFFSQHALAVKETTGNTPWTILLCKFKDVPDEPITVEDADLFFTETGAGTGTMFDYWKDMSFGRIDLTGSKAHGWFELPFTRKDFLKVGGEGPEGRDAKLEACVKQAGDLGKADRIVVIWNTPIDLPSGSLGRVQLAPVNMDPATVAHEMGHGYGLLHSWGGQPAVEYGDAWDIMSHANDTYGFNAPMGYSGPGLNASFRALLGWLDPKRIADLAPDKKRKVVRLDSLSVEAGSDIHMARIKLSPDEHFDVEMRTRDGWDQGLPGQGSVFVRRVGSTQVPVLKMSAQGTSHLRAGQRVIDALADVQVRVLSADGATKQADIEVGPVGPSTRATIIPPPNARGWNNTSVVVQIDATFPVQRYTVPLITVEVQGPRPAAPISYSAFTARVSIHADGLHNVVFSAADTNGNHGDQVPLPVFIDTTPPQSTVTLVPTPAGFEARIVAQDLALPNGDPNAISGVREIRYNLGGFGPDHVVPGNQATVLIPASGSSILIFGAVDEAGNEERRTLTVAPSLQVSPPRLNLVGPVGAYSAPNYVTLRNNGMASMNIVSVMTDSWYFRAIPGSTCVGVLAGGATCLLAVDFFAPAAFSYDATLYIRTDDIHQLDHTVALHGDAAVPSLTFNPNSVTFADMVVGSGFAGFVPVQIGNNGVLPVVISSISTGTYTFNPIYDGCSPKPYTLYPGTSCSVSLAFAPPGPGLHRGALQVFSNIPGPPQSMPLQGTGIAMPQLSASPNPIAFTSTAVGQTRNKKVIIRNDGSSPAFVQDFAIVGPGAAMFQITMAKCQNGTPPISIEPGQTCGLTINYTPASSATHTAILRANLSNSPAPFDVPIGGSAP